MKMNTRQISRVDIVLSLIKKATEYPGNQGVNGKKALQKSLYFLNQNNALFYFRWADYGPFCGEIQQIIEYLIAGEDVKVDEVKTKKKGAIIQRMRFVQNKYTRINVPKEIQENLDKIVKFAAGKNPRDLELLASVHFWATRQQDEENKYSDEYIHDKLIKLKPDAGFTIHDVQGAIDTLKTENFLS